MLQFVLGRAGSGKTEYMRRVLSDRSLNDHDRCGDSRCMMIVPEQFSFETEKAVLRLAGPIQLYPAGGDRVSQGRGRGGPQAS